MTEYQDEYDKNIEVVNDGTNPIKQEESEIEFIDDFPVEEYRLPTEAEFRKRITKAEREYLYGKPKRKRNRKPKKTRKYKKIKKDYISDKTQETSPTDGEELDKFIKKVEDDKPETIDSILNDINRELF